MSNKAYTGKDIKVLTDHEHVRKRLNVYLGSVSPTTYTIPMLGGSTFETREFEFIPAAYRAVEEIIGNAHDELIQIDQRVKKITIEADPASGKFSVEDNGRGVPIDKHETGSYTPEVVFGTLRSGRNFNDDERTQGVIGVNGVGSSVTAAISTNFNITINRDGKRYTQQFLNGVTKISKPEIVKTRTKVSGTKIEFSLDPKVLGDVSLPPELFENRAIEIAMTNPEITVEYNGEEHKFGRGMSTIVNRLFKDKKTFRFTIDTPAASGDIFVVLDAHTNQDEQMFTWVNNTLLFDGGRCNTQFVNAFSDEVIKHLERDAKRKKSEVTKNDVRQGLTILANLKMTHAEYDSQSKTRLTGPDLRRQMISIVDEQWKDFAKANGAWLSEVLERAVARYHSSENKKAIAEHQKGMKKRVEGLLDASSRNRFECQLIITEGDSAAMQICAARDPKTTASFALTGKINNVYKSTPAQVLKMGKLTDMLAAIGLTPGRKADRSAMNFGRVVIASDSDPDGGDIFSLLVNLFYKFWPELFHPDYEPFFYRLIAPNVVASKGKTRVHYATMKHYEKNKSKHNGWKIQYMKGLGSLLLEDWEMILGKESAVYIPIVDDEHLPTTLELLFGDNADARKVWLASKQEEK